MEQTKRQWDSIVDNNKKKKKLIIDFDTLITRFEDLSNETIYEVFEFLDFRCVYEAFYNLNIRFQNLFTYSSVPINMNLSFISKTSFQCYYSNIIIPCQCQIKCLYLSNPFFIEHVFSVNDISLRFLQLKKLNLTCFNPVHLEKLFRHSVAFPCLFSLVINCIDGTKSKTNFYRRIFLLPALKYCKLIYEKYTSYGSLPVATTKFSPIEHLIIHDGMNWNKIYALLSYIPQVRCLSLHTSTIDHDEQLQFQPIPLNHLIDVCLDLTFTTFNTFEYLVKNFFRQAQTLRLSSMNDRTYFNGNRWQQLISSYTPYLKNLDINILHTLNPGENTFNYETQFNRFHSSFWLDRHWFFRHHLHKQGSDDCISFFSINPYRRAYYSLHQQGSKTTGLNGKKFCVDSVHHVRIENKQLGISCENYFSNAYQLTLSSRQMKRTRTFLSFNLDRVIPLKQLTILTINHYHGCFSKIIQLLRCTPNINTFTIEYLSDDGTDFQLIRNSNIFRSVSNTNRITKMKIISEDNIRKIKFLLNLCPRVQQLTIQRPKKRFHSIVEYLFSKDNPNIRHLYSLCIENMPQHEIEIFKKFIESNKLRYDYSIYVKQDILNSSMYFWW